MSLLATSCTQPGSVTLNFVWKDRPPSRTEGLWFHATAEERVGAGPGKVLGADVTPFAFVSSLGLADIPHGDHRVVIAEIRDGRDRDRSSLLYTGTTEPFSLRRGADVVVDTFFELARVVSVPTTGGVEVLQAEGGRYVNTKDVTLRVLSARASQFAIARDVAFVTGAATLEAAPHLVSAESSTTGYAVYDVPYDLDDGGCGVQLCADGPRDVYVQVLDAQGNRSAPVTTAVVLDTTGPLVASARILPAVASGSATVTVELTASELLRAAPRLRVVEAPSFELALTAGPPGGAAIAYAWASVDRASTLGPDGVYSIEAELVDLAGNTAAGRVGALGLDTSPPLVTGATVSPSRVGETHGAPIDIRFTLSELLDLHPPALRLIVGEGEPTPRCRAAGSPPAIEVVCSYDVTGQEIAAGTERAVPVVILVRDAAGHVDAAGTELTLDYKPPAIRAGSTTLELVPAPSNPLWAPTKVTGGTTVRVGFAIDEPISGAPLVSTRSPQQLAFAQVGRVGDRYIFEHTLDETWDIQGSYTVEAVVTDTVGHRATLELTDAGFDVDTDPPAPPETEREGARVVHRRVPWGSEATGGQPLATLFGPNNAAPPDTTLIVFGDVASSSELGRAAVDAQGGFAALEVAPAASRVWVGTIDDAGNVSETRPVRSGDWTATLIGSVAGSASPHPLRLGLVAHRAPTLMQTTDLGAEPATQALAGAARVGGGSLNARTHRVDWVDRTPTGARPPARTNHAMAYDAVRGRVVMFGGVGASGRFPLADTWEWDGFRWHEVMPAGPIPAARWRHDMAFDAARGRVVLFGGAGDPDFWEWDGTRWIPRPNRGAPAAEREVTAMAYDPDRGEVVVAVDELLYTWDGEAASVVSTRLGAVQGRALAYDSARQRLVLAELSGGLVREWDGTSWVTRRPATRPPSPFWFRAAVTYDPVRQRVVTFSDGETWEWDGATWVDVSPAGSSPPALYHAAMVYDVARRSVLLFGGSTSVIPGEGTSDQTWRWDGARWTDLSEDGASPAQRQGHTMAEDPGRGQVVLFGGRGAQGLLSDTWRWDGLRWAATSTSGGAAPDAREGHAMTYDASRGELLLYGGRGAGDVLYTDLWRWTGTSWIQLSPSGTAPPPRTRAALAYHAAEGEVVLFGGEGDGSPLVFNDTWVWDGSGWSSLAPASAPLGIRGHAMVDDPTRGQVLLFGGERARSVSSDTWTWDGAGWRRAPFMRPHPEDRFDHALVYDAALGAPLLLGGEASLGYRGDAWLWTGTAWRELGAGSHPWPRARARAGAASRADGGVVVFDGRGGRGDTWTLDTVADQRSGAIITVDWGAAAGVNARVEAVEATVHAGGGGAPTGVELMAWDARSGRWVDWASNAAPPGAPAPLRHTITGADDAGRFVLERDGVMHALVRTAGISEAAVAAELSIDYVEVRISYLAEE